MKRARLAVILAALAAAIAVVAAGMGDVGVARFALHAGVPGRWCLGRSDELRLMVSAVAATLAARVAFARGGAGRQAARVLAAVHLAGIASAAVLIGSLDCGGLMSSESGMTRFTAALALAGSAIGLVAAYITTVVPYLQAWFAPRSHEPPRRLPILALELAASFVACAPGIAIVGPEQHHEWIYPGTFAAIGLALAVVLDEVERRRVRPVSLPLAVAATAGASVLGLLAIVWIQIMLSSGFLAYGEFLKEMTRLATDPEQVEYGFKLGLIALVVLVGVRWSKPLGRVGVTVGATAAIATAWMMLWQNHDWDWRWRPAWETVVAAASGAVIFGASTALLEWIERRLPGEGEA